MAKRPKLDEVEKLLSQNKAQFSLTDEKYEKLTGTALPKDKNYLQRRSALCRKAAEKGYRISVQPKTVTFIKEK